MTTTDADKSAVEVDVGERGRRKLSALAHQE
jgi:hypothetical protein